MIIVGGFAVGHTFLLLTHGRAVILLFWLNRRFPDRARPSLSPRVAALRNVAARGLRIDRVRATSEAGRGSTSPCAVAANRLCSSNALRRARTLTAEDQLACSRHTPASSSTRLSRAARRQPPSALDSPRGSPSLHSGRRGAPACWHRCDAAHTHHTRTYGACSASPSAELRSARCSPSIPRLLCGITDGQPVWDRAGPIDLNGTWGGVRRESGAAFWLTRWLFTATATFGTLIEAARRTQPTMILARTLKGQRVSRLRRGRAAGKAFKRPGA